MTLEERKELEEQLLFIDLREILEMKKAKCYHSLGEAFDSVLFDRFSHLEPVHFGLFPELLEIQDHLE